MKKYNFFTKRIIFVFMEMVIFYFFITTTHYMYILFFLMILWLDLWVHYRFIQTEIEEVEKILGGR